MVSLCPPLSGSRIKRSRNVKWARRTVAERRVEPVTKTQDITAAEFRRRFVDGQGDRASDADHAVAENMVDKIAHGHSKGQRGGNQRDHGRPRIPRKEKLLGDVPGSKILENRDVRDPIISFLQVHGWFVFKHWQGTSYCYPGIPDIEAIRDGVVVYIECKRPGGKLSSDQKQFRDDWMEHGGRWIKAERLEDVEFMAKRGGDDGGTHTT